MNINIETREYTLRRGIKPFAEGMGALTPKANCQPGFECLEGPEINVGSLGTVQASLISDNQSIILEDSNSYFIDKEGRLGTCRTKDLEDDKRFKSFGLYLISPSVNESNTQNIGDLDCLIWVGKEFVMKSRLKYDMSGEFESICNFTPGEWEEANDLYLEMDDNLLKKVQVGFEKSQHETGGED